MRHTYLLLLGGLLSASACRNNMGKEEANKISAADTSKKVGFISPIEKNDPSNQYIYDFMKIVIADQKIDLHNGLRLKPERNCDIAIDDTTFLRALIFEKVDTTDHTLHGSIGIQKCLTENDVDYMLMQKGRLSNFYWDNARLGFDCTNQKGWYSFSVPVFSLDKTKAIMKIEWLCNQGVVCGSGSTVIFTKEKEKWTSKVGSRWYH